MSYLKIGKYYGEDPNLPTYQVKEVLDTNYLDITSVTHWFTLQDEIGKDYLFCRDGTIGFINGTTGFSGLTQSDKEYSAQNFCVSKTDRDTIYTDVEQEGYWTQFVVNSKEVRNLRWEKSKVFISYRLSLTDSSDLAVSTLDLNQRYVEYGIESLSEDGQDGLFDWISGEGSFVSNGFPSKSYYTLELKNEILNRLNGLL
tara:strand:+ start:471 stop:1070 length:600 start_codon:yes stop_codon:yes gene_type:complete